jgi:hypothetical protein
MAVLAERLDAAETRRRAAEEHARAAQERGEAERRATRLAVQRLTWLAGGALIAALGALVAALLR